MSTWFDPANYKRIAYGIQVPRTAALPPASGATQDLFTVDGGKVQLTGFFGYVTVAIPNESIDFTLDHDPDDGGSDVALATLLAVDNTATGTFFTLNATNGGALVATLDLAYNAVPLGNPILLDEGDIKLTSAGGGAIGATARVEWTAFYIPIDAGATLTAS